MYLKNESEVGDPATRSNWRWGFDNDNYAGWGTNENGDAGV